jgi:VIT1/CCC1 family predicted Fe2+/Mn2+ transporter
MHHDQRLKEIEEHVITEHRQSPVAAYLKEVIYGGIDGIITTFAVVAGFSGAALTNEITTQLSFMVVLLFGLANLFADAVSMGLGNFLAVRSDQSQYCSIRAKERREMLENHERELEETTAILIDKGFSQEDARTLAQIYSTNEKYWLDFMMNHELNIPDPTDDNPAYTGFATFVSFIFFGFIPLIPFVFLRSLDPQSLFILASVGVFTALILLGILKWKIIGAKLWSSLFEVLLIGGVAAGIAFFVGSLFSI